MGDWTVEGDIAGNKVKGQWSAQWAPQQHCILIHSSLSMGDGQVTSNGVSGWDAAKEQIVTMQSFSNGVIEDTRYKIAAPGVLKGVYTISAADEPLKVDCEIRAKQPNEWTFTSSANVFAGEKGTEFTLRFVRSETKPKDEQAVSPAYEHLKDLEDFLGDWVAEETLNQDMPGIAKKGDKLRYRASFRWIQNKAIMQMDFSITVSDGKNLSARYLFGWDAVDKKIMHSGFDTGGGRDWAALKKEGPDKWTWENKWAGADGSQGSGLDTTTILDDNNTHVHEYTNTVVDGKPQPDRRVVYKRVK
ncbi:MAG: hypothetical protein ACYC0X_27340 [Pirellulaceae bacterium]